MPIKQTIVQLSDCCEIFIGRNIDNKKLNEVGAGLPYIVGASDMKLGAFVPRRYCACDINNPVYSEKGDLLISVVGTLGKMAVNTVGRAILSRHVCAVRINKEINRHYVMALVSRLILEAIPDVSDTVMGFQAKLDIDALRQIRFVLPNLAVQDWLTCRLSSIASILLAARDKPECYLDVDSLAKIIDDERSECRKKLRKMADALINIKNMLENLPQDSETIQIINDTHATLTRLLKIQ